MTNNSKDSLEPFTITEDEMMTIVALAKAIKAYSKNKTVSSLLQELELEEFCSKDTVDSNKIIWQKPMINLVKSIEKKFANRLKQYKKLGLI